MINPIKVIKAYGDFKALLKEGKNRNSKRSLSFDCCFITTKIDMIKWKEYFEYDESLLTNTYEQKNWESKIKIKLEKEPMPKLKLLKSINEITNNLTKGISIINLNFIDALGLKGNYKLPRVCKCYIFL